MGIYSPALLLPEVQAEIVPQRKVPAAQQALAGGDQLKGSARALPESFPSETEEENTEHIQNKCRKSFILGREGKFSMLACQKESQIHLTLKPNYYSVLITPVCGKAHTQKELQSNTQQLLF